MAAFCLLAAGTDAQTTAVHSNAPALSWEDAMLSGNGQTGVMQYGSPRDERFVLNDHRLLVPNGAPVPIPDMADAMAEMQRRFLAGEIGDGWADFLAELRERGNLPRMVWTQKFHPSHALRVAIDGEGEVTDYKRTTNYRTGEIVVTWTDSRGDWIRRTFVSRADGVVVTELTPPAGRRAFGCRLSAEPTAKHRDNVPHETFATTEGVGFRARYPAVTIRQEAGGPGTVRKGGYEGWTRVAKSDRCGEATVEGDAFQIKAASRLLLLTRVARYRDDHTEWSAGKLKAELDQIEPDYEKLLARHVAIHQPIFDRVGLRLDVAEADRGASTTELIERAEDNDQAAKTALLEKLFATSRYLFISSCGPEYGPRLSGVFLGAWGAAWSGDYTCDANVNLAVIGGNLTAMPECMAGYFAILERTMPQWRDAAQKLYGCRGILGPVRIDGEVAVHHHVNDYHAHLTATAFGPWLLGPMWEHYLVTGDTDFLRDRLYPLLREQAQFYEDFLTHRDDNGKFVFVPSNSSENAWPGVQPRTSASINSLMDIGAFKHCLKMLRGAEEALGIEPDADSQRWLAMEADAPPYLLTDQGILKEWAWPTYGEHYGHRHSSHIYPLFPGGDLSVDDPATAPFCDAMAKSLDKRRRKIKQAHDLLQKAIAWIRLKRADRFGELLDYFLTAGYVFDGLATSHDAGRNIYNFDSILCLNGLVAESIVFTDQDTIELLPALPAVMPKGEATGLRGRNQVTFDRIAWDTEARTLELKLTSAIDQTITLKHRAGIQGIDGGKNALAITPGDDTTRRLVLQAGEPIRFRLTW